MSAEFLIFPIILEPTNIDEIWKVNGDFLIKNRNCTKIKNCYFARKNWVIEKFASIESTKKFIDFIQKNNGDHIKIDLIINEYLEDRAVEFDNTINCDYADLPDPATSVDSMNEMLIIFSKNTDKFAEIIRYKRQIKGENVACDWIVIKLGTLNSKIKDDDANLTKCLIRLFNSSFSNVSNVSNYKMVFDINFNININIDCKKTNNQITYHTDNDLKGINNNDTIPFYNLQISVGNAIFEKITKHISEKNQIFSLFKFVLLIPPRNSLKDQTIKRLKQTYSNQLIQRLGHNSTENIDFVFMALDKNFKEFDKIIKSADQNKDCLYLIIQDECHWGMLAKSVLDKYLNNETMFNSNNIYLLYVSATPYNIEIYKQMGWNSDTQIVKWDDIASSTNDLAQENNNYNGLEKLFQQEKIKPQSDQSKECIDNLINFNEIAHLFINKSYVESQEKNLSITEQEISLLVEYVVTLYYLFLKKKIENFDEVLFKKSFSLSHFLTEETKIFLESLMEQGENGKGNLVLLRMNNSVIAHLFARWMKQLIKCFDQDLFDVVLDVNDEDSLWKCLSSTSQIKYKKWRGINETPLDINYNDLANLPILLIVVEKARMGDTLPHNFKYFDLRCRYNEANGTKTIYSSLIQDVGRAFGYGPRPCVYLTKFIHNILNPRTVNGPDFKLNPHQTLKLDNEVSKHSITDPLDLWKMGEKHQQFRNDLDNDAFKRRFLFSAHPQNGKTGAFLYAVQKFANLYLKSGTSNTTCEKKLSADSSLNRTDKRFQSLLDKFKNTSEDNLKIGLQTSGSTIQSEWNEFHVLLEQRRKLFVDKKIKLNYEYCIDYIKNYCNKDFLNNNVVRILDLGCGNAHIAQHFYDSKNQEYIYDSKTKNKKFKLDIQNIDYLRHKHVPQYITINETNISSVSTYLGEEHFDIIIFCLSLWGTGDDILNYMKEARKLIKNTGKIIVAENNKNFIHSQKITSFIFEKTSNLFNFRFKDLNNDFSLMYGYPLNEEDENMEID
jgi:SAM-dependent methyltransferase